MCLIKKLRIHDRNRGCDLPTDFEVTPTVNGIIVGIDQGEDDDAIQSKAPPARGDLLYVEGIQFGDTFERAVKRGDLILSSCDRKTVCLMGPSGILRVYGFRKARSMLGNQCLVTVSSQFLTVSILEPNSDHWNSVVWADFRNC